MSFIFTVGVEEFHCSSERSCHQNNARAAQFTLSFGVNGNFLPAALSDSLDDAVDYDALCEELRKSFSALSCDDHEHLIARARATVMRFSPKITGGYLCVGIRCHKPFIVQEALL